MSTDIMGFCIKWYPDLYLKLLIIMIYYYVGISIILVPNEPINFTVTSKYLYFSNIHITLNWIQPQSSDEDGVVDYFILYIQSTLGTDVISNIQSSNWSLILYYQIKYKIIINAVNCVGKSPEKTIFCKWIVNTNISFVGWFN